MARIDFFLTTSDIQSKLLSTTIISGYRTDHSAIILDIQIHNIKRGRGFWKFNSSLLYDIDCKFSENVIKNTVETHVNNTDLKGQFENKLSSNHQLLFEMLKLNIRGETIALNFRKAKDRHKIEANLEKQIANFEKSLSEFSNIDDTAGIVQTEKDLEKAKLQLVQVHEPLVRAAIL